MASLDRYTRWAAVAACALGACHRAEAPSPPLAPPAAVAPVRGAVGDNDLRVMLSEIASSQACDMIEGHFVALPAVDRPDVMTGVLWLRRCKITNDGTRVAFELAGNGWQWAELTEHQAGGTFAVRQYVNFAFDARLRGSIDLAYDRGAHVLSLWFTPSAAPAVDFHTVGDVEVDSKGLWSSVVGGVASVLSDSPGEQGTQVATQRGTDAFAAQLANGLTFVVNLCTGDQRATLGRLAKGSMGKAGVGQTRRVSVEIEPNGLMLFGPYVADAGMTVNVDSDGPVRIGLACAAEADAAADAFVGDRPPPWVKTLGQADIDGHGAIRIRRASCPVVVVARSIAPARVTFDYARPAGEQARSTGGPIVRCR